MQTTTKWLPTLKGGRKAHLQGRAVRTHDLVAPQHGHFPYVIMLPEEICFWSDLYSDRVTLCGKQNDEGEWVGVLTRVTPYRSGYQCVEDEPEDWDPDDTSRTLSQWLEMLGLDTTLEIAPLPGVGYMVDWLARRQQP